MARLIICSNCKREKEHGAKGLCKSCYQMQWLKNSPEGRKKNSIYNMKWASKNKEKAREINRRFWRRNKEHLKQKLKERRKSLEYKEWYKKYKKKANLIARRWHKENPDRARFLKKRYREENGEKVRIANKKWREDNPERTKINRKRWFEDNPEKVKVFRTINNHRRRSGEFFSKADLELALFHNFLKFGAHFCEKCGRFVGMPDSFFGHIDHIIPVSKSGNGNYENLQILCPKCNKEKCIDIIDYRNNAYIQEISQ